MTRLFDKPTTLPLSWLMIGLFLQKAKAQRCHHGLICSKGRNRFWLAKPRLIEGFYQRINIKSLKGEVSICILADHSVWRRDLTK